MPRPPIGTVPAVHPVEGGAPSPDERRYRAWKPWLQLFRRLALIFLGAALLLRLPISLVQEWLTVRTVAVAVVAVCLAGKSLYNSLFYDRFWP